MHLSTDRILVSHVGSLPRNEKLAGMRHAGLRADAHEVISRRHIRSDADGELHLVGLHLVHALLPQVLEMHLEYLLM